MTAIETVIVPPTKELAPGFHVRRARPAIERRMVGPFVFFDEMGPEVLGAGRGLDVRPHPHIGLATVTWLFRGEILHRDSLGCVQPIHPGELNWMTAGRGIVHSERTPPAARQLEKELYGIQTWVALPRDREEDEPSFVHHGAEELPEVAGDGKRLRIIVGSAYGATSPVKPASEMFYVEANLESGAELPVPATYEERAIWVAEGSIEIAGERHGRGQLLVLKQGETVVARAPEAARLMLLGGAPMDGHRHVWWNFVSSSRERIEQAKNDWSEGRFGQVPGETEIIPLPGILKKSTVRYP